MFNNRAHFVESNSNAILKGAHGSVHEILGGQVMNVCNIFLEVDIRDLDSDLGGTCPSTAPANCTPGPTFSANGEFFSLTFFFFSY